MVVEQEIAGLDSRRNLSNTLALEVLDELTS